MNIPNILEKMARSNYESNLQKVSITADDQTLRISADLRGGRLFAFGWFSLPAAINIFLVLFEFGIIEAKHSGSPIWVGIVGLLYFNITGFARLIQSLFGRALIVVDRDYMVVKHTPIGFLVNRKFEIASLKSIELRDNTRRKDGSRTVATSEIYCYIKKSFTTKHIIDSSGIGIVGLRKIYNALIDKLQIESKETNSSGETICVDAIRSN